jgi:hypothetical protein
MANTELHSNTKTEIEDTSSLNGTMVSVSFLGLFIVVTWVSVYFIFLNRL